MAVFHGLTLMSQPYLIATHDISSHRKTADTLLKLVLEDIDYCRNVLHIDIIAWCSDAGGDSASMRRKLKRECPSLIVVDCWAHQVFCKLSAC